MKPARITLHPHPATAGQERLSNGRPVIGACTEIFATLGPKVTIEIKSLDEIEDAAQTLATSLGKPCAVWIGLAHGQRTPRGFDAVAQDVSTIYRAPASATKAGAA